MAVQTQKVLEFPQVLQILAGLASTPLGKEYLTRLQPRWTLAEVQELLAEVAEAINFTVVEGPCNFSGCPDLKAVLPRVTVPGSILAPEDFNQIQAALRLMKRVQRYFGGAQEQQPRLRRYAREMRDLSAVQTAIQTAISPHGQILDQASPALAHIRQEIQATRQQISQKLHALFQQPTIRDILQDQIIAQRNGRSVIPIKADYKGRLNGIIHDQSQSKATLFIEPFEIVPMNNALNLLIGEETREEERILLHLTDVVRAHLDALQANLALVGEADALQAKVLFAQEFQARTPVLTSSGRVRLKEARHPLLLHRDKTEPGFQPTIPVDLELTPQSRFLVLSGANTGGKTVTLKTLGLLCLMAQAGIPLPVAEGSEICVFAGIYADIGDTQDLSQNLSTFSAHIRRAGEILSHLDGRCLVLLDELGTATDPTEGSALALALLRALARKGAYGVVTTHYHLLKAFAHEEPGFANVSVLFDEQTHKPLYRLAYGVAGPSNALKIARELGLPAEIIAAAESYLGQEGLQALQQLARCEAAQQNLAQREQELQRAEAELARRQAALAARQEQLEAERRRLLEEERREITAAIQKAEREFKEILRRLEQRQDSWGRLRQEFSAGQRRLQLLVTPPQTPAPTPEFQPQLGQTVWVVPLGQRGEVASEPDRDGRVAVRLGAATIRVARQDLQPSAPPAKEGRIYRSRSRGGIAAAPQASTWQSPSLNIIGLRVDEALPLVDRLLDQATLHGCRQVEIIHGLGTGRLQQAVRQHLQQHRLVAAYHAGEADQGGRGVTLVKLRD
ncbi:MAG: endonuclease MutS2 [Desulfobacca sp.]|uniref:endonuclease MutS2 n=1 Tax=Desulfobacca sp. TaxID=2067990 RepID=UPI00404B1270